MKRAAKRDRLGFTLVELMIVVAIVSILAALAVPSFYNFSIKSKRSEAYVGLGALHSAEVSFKASNDYFTLSLRQLGFQMGAEPNLNNNGCVEGAAIACGKFFYFYVNAASTNMFIAEAWGRPDPNADHDSFVAVYP